MAKFSFYWLDGKKDVFEGNDPRDALNKAGYGNGSLKALDFWATGDVEYTWSAQDHWTRVEKSVENDKPIITIGGFMVELSLTDDKSLQVTVRRTENPDGDFNIVFFNKYLDCG